MKDTVRIATISIDTERIQRDIYAESACIALMSTTKRPEILTGGKRKLIEIYIRNAITEFAAKFCAFIDGNSLNLEDAGTLQQIEPYSEMGHRILSDPWLQSSFL